MRMLDDVRRELRINEGQRTNEEQDSYRGAGLLSSAGWRDCVRSGLRSSVCPGPAWRRAGWWWYGGAAYVWRAGVGISGRRSFEPGRLSDFAGRSEWRIE